MSYTPTTWVTGNKVTATKLNKIETELVALDTDKANIDGYYEGMTVGNAEQLVATVGVNDSVPFNVRTTGGSADVGDRKTMEVVGGTVAWNQQFEVLSATDWTSTDDEKGTATFADGECTYTVVAPGASYVNGIMHRSSRLFGISGHKYFVSVDAKSSRSGITIGGDICNVGLYFAGTVDTDYKNFALVFSGTGYQAAYLCTRSGTEADDIVYFKNFMLIDLTQMFGSTIANYIYSLEQANAGAGVAWFKKLFPKPYYAYNAGELMSVKTSAYKTTGFNQFSNVTVKTTTSPYQNCLLVEADLLPNTQYCISFVDTADHKLYRNENLFKEGSGTIIATGQRQVVLATTVDTLSRDNNLQYDATVGWRIFKNAPSNENAPGFTDVCMNLHWDGERDGEYEPYEAHTYALDPDLELRGIPKLDADNQLYYDGDTYKADGTVGRRFGIVDLGSITWVRDTANNEYRFRSQGYETIPNAPTSGGSLKNILCGKYTQSDAPSAYNDQNGVICIFNGIPLIRDDAYTDADTFKTAMSGVKLVYELATPEEETADPFQTPQIVNDFGTEEFVDARTIPIPVGHNSKYQANLRAKLEMAPNSPSGDGDYIVRQASGQNTYVPITFPADELPAAPTTDGNYVLKCTVSSGTATFEWEAQT